MFFSYFLLLYICKTFTKSFEDTISIKVEKDIEQKINYRSILKEKYFILFFSVSIIAFFIFYFIDYIFYFKVEEMFTDEKELASFFGIFIAILNIINLFSSIYVSGKVLNRFGIFVALSIIPIIAFIGTSSYLLLGLISLSFAFFILVILKLLNEAFDTSILSPTYKVLYQSIGADRRRKVIAFRETIIEPFAMGIAGAALLFFSQNKEIWLVCIAILFLSILWLILAKYLKDNYLLSLKKLLTRRQIFGVENSFKNIDIEFLLKNLHSKNDLDVIYALEFLKRVQYKDLEQSLKSLLGHQSIYVKKKVLETIASLELKNLSSFIKESLEREKDEDILKIQIQTYTRLEKNAAIDTIKVFTNSNNKLLRDSAIVSLIKYCGISGILIANTTINKLFENKNDKTTIEILSIINDAGFYGFYKLLNQSLLSKSVEVKIQAIKTVGNLKLKRFIPNLFDALKDTRYRAVVLQALYKFKDQIIDDLIKEFLTNPSYDIKISFIKLLSSSKSPKALEFLFDQLTYPVYSYNIINALYHSNYTTKNISQIDKLLDIFIEMILLDEQRQIMIDKIKYPKTYELIKEEQKRKIDILFYILGFIYPKKTINESKINYKSNSKNLQALSLELLDNMLESDLKIKIIPILENFKNKNKMLYLLNNYTYKNKIKNFDNYIKTELLKDRMEFALKLTLIYEIGLNKDRKFYEQIKTLSKTHKNKYILETACWCLEQFNKEG